MTSKKQDHRKRDTGEGRVYVVNRDLNKRIDATLEEFLATDGSKIRNASLYLYQLWFRGVTPAKTWFNNRSQWLVTPSEDCWRYKMALEVMDCYFQLCYEYFKSLNQAVTDALHQKQGRFLQEQVLQDVTKHLVKEEQAFIKEGDDFSKTCMKQSLSLAMKYDEKDAKELMFTIVQMQRGLSYGFTRLIQLYKDLASKKDECLSQKEIKIIGVVDVSHQQKQHEIEQMFRVLSTRDSPPPMVPFTCKQPSDGARWTRWKQSILS